MRGKILKLVVTGVVTMVVEKLVRLGLSEYEARVYAALVGLGRATAREIHEASGVPRARVYDVLKRLADRGFVDVEEGEPRKFAAVNPRSAVGRLKNEIIALADECIAELEALKLDVGYQFSPALVARGDGNILEKVRESIRESNTEILAVTASPELILSVADDVRRWSRSGRKFTCYLLKNDEKLLEYADCIELWETVNITPMIRRMHFEGLIEKGAKVTIESVLTFDGKKSIIVVNENGRRVAVVISLPIIAIMHSTMIKTHFSRVARKIS